MAKGLGMTQLPKAWRPPSSSRWSRPRAAPRCRASCSASRCRPTSRKCCCSSGKAVTRPREDGRSALTRGGCTASTWSSGREVLRRNRRRRCAAHADQQVGEVAPDHLKPPHCGVGMPSALVDGRSPRLVRRRARRRRCRHARQRLDQWLSFAIFAGSSSRRAGSTLKDVTRAYMRVAMFSSVAAAVAGLPPATSLPTACARNA